MNHLGWIRIQVLHYIQEGKLFFFTVFFYNDKVSTSLRVIAIKCVKYRVTEE